MRALLTKYKLVIRFILTFVLVYSVLSFAYKFYLDFSDGSKYYPDYMTHLVGKQTEAVLNTLNYTTNIVPHPDEPSLMVFMEQKYLARIIEGCNSLSVIILFISFVVAFSDTFKRTFLFILAGSVLIYCVNLLRIILLTIGLYKYPWRSELMHEVIFPLAIYGMVFLLWMFWVNQFSKPKRVEDD
ncbi:MAG: exosortase family protein XrtF [Winogradskyella sp.]|uniref:exosortase family protein XrtF n=1 Tax=Winogradskyella sp. TaxID=1883156 RepID=UPI000F3C15FF|nr:exosortase family protein XrtF [Winogradskyella sp.]RNC85090.1 MAG: exosortase family protein XrtF [Winogradskyella sp.]